MKDLNNTIVAFKSKAKEKINSREGYSKKFFVSGMQGSFCLRDLG